MRASGVLAFPVPFGPQTGNDTVAVIVTPHIKAGSASEDARWTWATTVRRSDRGGAEVSPPYGHTLPHSDNSNVKN